jgi:subtilisin family serine protease
MMTNIDAVVAKQTELTEEAVHAWPHMDIFKDSIPGISVDKAHAFLVGKTPQTVTVAVIDSGIDIEHEDLDGMIWTNEDEVANNGKDDDNNGYVDDMHGWNFLGGKAGQSCPEQLEITRIVTKLSSKYDGKTADDIAEADQEEFAYFTKLKTEVESKQKQAAGQYTFYKGLVDTVKGADTAVKEALGKDSYTLEELTNVELDASMAMGKNMLMRLKDAGMTLEEGLKDIQRGVDYFKQQSENHYNVNFKGRLTDDNPCDITDTNYGNNMVIGSKDVESHGTHVSGIILAERNNGVGMNGVTNYAKLMSIRAVPDGDEYDKDVALAIRYAADNGAKVVNMSFGKSYSPHSDWVYEAIKYAESKDVLLVHAAGNDGSNIDTADNFPNDSKDKVSEFSDNVLTVGAMTRHFDENLPAGFSNYGKLNVDVFAPGHDVYSTTPKDSYDSYPGTSMAAPQVAGVAALIRAYYPNLTASEVKHIIMNSSIKPNFEVNVPTEDGKASKALFSTLSVSGGVLNAYNAVVLADKKSRGK